MIGSINTTNYEKPQLQKIQGGGDNINPLTWNYYAIVGKIDESGQRMFRFDDRQFQPTYFIDIGKTVQGPESIAQIGEFDRKVNEYIRQAQI
jgi:hypothetical protein